MTQHACPYEGCTRSFPRPSKLEIHLNIHRGKNPFVCKLNNCGKVYNYLCHLQRHTRKHHASGRHKYVTYRCEYSGCRAKFNSQYALKKHEKKHRLFFKCDCCLRFFHSEATYKTHRLIHESKLAKQQAKQRTKSDNDRKRQESLEVKSQTEYECYHCNMLFRRKRYMLAHILSLHSKKQRFWLCPDKECTKVYYYKRNVEHHIKTTHDNLRYKCDNEGCLKEFISRQGLKKHKRNMHTPNNASQ